MLKAAHRRSTTLTRRGKEVVIRKGKNNSGAICIGRMPIMLRSDR